MSDTLSQVYTDLQSSVKYLDHRDIASDTAACACMQCAVKLGCAGLRNALKCISEATKWYIAGPRNLYFRTLAWHVTILKAFGQT